MSRSKLVIVEGIPGSGKTATARLVSDWLGQNGLQPRLHLEGDLDHPADYESVACLQPQEWTQLLERFPEQAGRLQEVADPRGGEIFLSYRKLPDLPSGLFAALAQRDIYELPLPDWQRLTQARWEDFAQAVAEQPDTYVFECCFLQNLLTTPLAKFDQPEDEAAEHVLRVARALKKLHPVVLYLDPPSVRRALERVSAERPREWLDFVIAYTAGQAWGSARGLGGFEGMLRFYETRRALEHTLFPALGALHFRLLWLSNAGLDWTSDHARIRTFLYEAIDQP